MTATVLIGNSDNKLSQGEWAHYVAHVDVTMREWSTQVHFFGGPATYDPWQTACWVCEIDAARVPELTEELTQIRITFRQDSAAMLLGDTVFV